MAEARQLASIGKHEGQLELVWSDGSRSLFTPAEARERCKCSQCQSTRLSTGQDPQVDPAVALLEIRPIGAYAVQLVFSDGHERGIFPYEYLAGWVQEAEGRAR
ncbi:MAG: DUF971 domain-containing protein [Massilia sp.]